MKYPFFVTAMGELLRDDEVLGNTINLKELSVKAGIEFSYPETPEWRQAIRNEFEEWEKENLTETERLFANKVFEFQENLNSSRCRVYGWIEESEKQVIILVTEFLEFVDSENWTEIYEIGKALEATVNTMCEHPHLNSKSLDNGITWIEGPNHGRMERQVEFSWSIQGLTIEEAVTFKELVEKLTQPIWEKCGVGVL